MKKLFLIVMLFISVSAQAVELSFKNPVLESGSDKRVGAIYRFSNVTTNIDALVKIVSFNHGASLANIDETSGGLDDAFQPTLHTGSNSDSSIDFEITFVNRGTSTEKTISLNATGADIDGDSRSVKEYIVLSKPKSYSLEDSTRLEVSTVSDGIYVISKTTANVSGITVSETRNIVTASYENVSKLTYTIGAKNGYGTKRWNSLYFKDVSFSNPDVVSISLPATTGEIISLNGKLRDFYDWSKDRSKNSDFENTAYVHGLVTGLVNDNLGDDKKPQFKSSYGNLSVKSITNAETFSQWFIDVAGINRSMPYELQLQKQGDFYVYDSDVTPVGDTSGRYKGFFPLDELLIGNEGHPHNYHFTYQINSQFTYQGGEVFTFSGDDDVWVFINGKLAVDVGGVHGRVEKSINLDDEAANLGITIGGTYDFDFFFAERHQTGSNLKITTSMVLESVIEPEPEPNTGSCKSIFSSVLNTTSADKYIELKGNGRIYNNNQPLITKSLLINGPVTCDGKNCTKSDTLAEKYDVIVTRGSGKNGMVSLKNTSSKNITDAKEYLSLTADDSSVVNINGDVTIKVKNTFTIHGDAQLNINGNVTIYADNISIAGKMEINTDNGVLTLIANNIDWSGNTTVNSHANPNLVLLSTGKIGIYGTSDLTAIIYAETTAELYGNNKLTGSITAAKIRMHGHDYVTYDSSIVDAYCGSSNEKPVITILDSEVIEGDDSTTDLIFTVTLDKDAGTGVSFKYQVFDANNSDTSLNASSDDYEKLDFKSSVILEGSDRTIEIKIPVKGDTLLENDEQFRLVLSDISGATFGNSPVIGTILDNDGAIGCTQDSWIVKDSESLFKMDIVNKSEEEFTNVIKETNALGYNETDGYLWGYNIKDKNSTLVRIGNKFGGSYTSETFGPIDGVPTDISIFIGDVDSYGHLYMMQRKTQPGGGLTTEKDIVYVVDLNNSSQTYLKLIDTFEVRDYNRGELNEGKALAIVDWAFHPKNGKLYSVSYDGRFYEIDPITHNVKESKSIVGLDDTTDYETFFDENGFLYLYGKKIGTVYRLDLTDATRIDVTKEINAVVFATNLGKSEGGDAARCAQAPMGDKPIVTLKSSVLEAEGNSGTTSIYFQMEADRVFNGSFDVNYEISSGTAKIDDDFVRTSGSVTCTISGDNHVLNCELPIVKGDIIKEPDETFTVSFTSDNVIFINGENKTTGTIINDDSNSFTAYDIGSSTREIQTKIVGKDFNLTLARLDSTGALTSFGDENSTKVRIVDSSACGNFHGDMSGFVDFNINSISTVKSPIFNSSIAIKRAKVQIYWVDEKDVNQTVCSADSFSIRPDRYSLSLSSTDIKSGEDFNLTIEAKDVNNNPVSNYNELFSVYALAKSEIKASSGCALGTLATVAQTNFVNGVSIVTLNYKDIGKLKFVVSEVNSSVTEYAHVDADDGSLDNRFITEATITHKIEPAKIKAVFSFKTKNNKNYTYYSADPAHMGAIIDANITMLNKDDNPVSNFSSSCWADDVSLAINFSQLDGVINAPMFKDANGTDMGNIMTSSKLHYTLSKESFISGKSSREILMNFGRSVKDAEAPIKIKLSSPKASLSSGLNTNVTLEKTIDFVYARAHAPKVQSIVDENMQAVVGYEVYIPKTVDKSQYGFSGLPVSEDFTDWYVLPDDVTFGFATGFAPFARFTGVSIESFTNNSISLKVTKTPHSNRIFFTPKEYLVYNQFNANAKADSFQVNFYNKKNTWIGKGKHGIVFDDKASKHGLNKMNW